MHKDFANLKYRVDKLENGDEEEGEVLDTGDNSRFQNRMTTAMKKLEM